MEVLACVGVISSEEIKFLWYWINFFFQLEIVWVMWVLY